MRTKEILSIKLSMNELLDIFKEEIAKNEGLSLEIINTRISDWKNLGLVPTKMRHIDSKFNKAIDLACKTINISKDEASLLKFKNLIDGYLDQKDVRKIDNEQLFVRRKIDELTKEINTIRT